MTNKPEPITNEQIRHFAEIQYIHNSTLLHLRSRIASGAEIDCSDGYSIELESAERNEKGTILGGMLRETELTVAGLHVSWPVNATSEVSLPNHRTEDRIALMSTLLRVLMACDDDSTPAEDFIVALLRAHHVRPLDPARVKPLVEHFEERFSTAQWIAKQMIERYPDLFKNATAA